MSSETGDRLVVIDTDAGVDDIVALDWVLSMHGRKSDESLGVVRVLAVTVTCGNVELDKAVRNCRLAVARRGLAAEIPVYAGASRPLMGQLNLPHWRGHGDDGLGGSPHLLGHLQSRHGADDTDSNQAPLAAVQALFDVAKRCAAAGTRFDVVALGPLTNVAIALLAGGDELAARVGRFVWMGGCSYAIGNATPTGEYNAITDPDAARVCFERLPVVEMVSWELTRKVTQPWSWMDERGLSTMAPGFDERAAQLLADGLSTRQFFSFLMYSYERLYRQNDVHQDEGFVLCDTVAVAVWLYPGLRLKTAAQSANVETAGVLTRGTVAIDWYGKGYYGDRAANLMHVLKIDVAGFLRLFDAYVSQ